MTTTQEQILKMQPVLLKGGIFGDGVAYIDGHFAELCPQPQNYWSLDELKKWLPEAGAKYSNLNMSYEQAAKTLQITEKSDEHYTIDDILKSDVLKAALNDVSGRLPMNAEYTGNLVKFQGATLGDLIMEAHNNIDGRSTVIDEGYIAVLHEVLRGIGYDRTMCNAVPIPSSETRSIAVSPPRTGDGGYFVSEPLVSGNHVFGFGHTAFVGAILLAIGAGIIYDHFKDEQ